ncbi:hypothetical protein [Herbaspirillum rubrisubalbicans]|uniref:hypothetical protein n=1 Tax=Herbaspirillum rubrisubalbicans TaxID=80842 RepID=UPI0012E3F7BC|nr:hypothetical protein [Herbaspirillum rubrisubalbicans]
MSMRRVCDAKLTQDLLQTYTSLQRSKPVFGCDAAGKPASAKALRVSEDIAPQRHAGVIARWEKMPEKNFLSGMKVGK